MHVHRALGHPGRTRGIEPEARIVAGRRRGCELGFASREHILEREVPPSVAAGDDDVLEERQLPDERGELRHEVLRDDERSRAAVREHVLVVLGREQRVHRDGHHARLDRAQERGGEIDRIGEREQHPVLHLQAHCLKPRAEAVDALRELAEAVLSRVVDVGDPRRAACGEVALEQVVSGVVVAGNPDDGRADRMIDAAARGHSFSQWI